MANSFENDKTGGNILKALNLILPLIDTAQKYLNATQREEREKFKKMLLNEVTEKEAIFKMFEYLLLPDNNTLKSNSSSTKYIVYNEKLDIYKKLFHIATDFNYSEGIAIYFDKLEKISQKIRELTSIKVARSQINWNDPTQHQNAVNMEELNDLEMEYNDYLTLFDLASKSKNSNEMEICFKKLIEIVQKIGTKRSVKVARSQISWNDPSQHQNAVNMEEAWELSGNFDELENLFKIANDNNYQQGMQMCFKTMIDIFNELHKKNAIYLTTYLKRIANVIKELNDKDLINLLYTWAIEKYGEDNVKTLFYNQTQDKAKSAL